MVKAVAVIVEVGFRVEVFCREAMAEEAGVWAGLGYGVAKSIVGVLGDRVAVGIEVSGDVAVVVVERDVDGIVDRKVEESSDAARALQCTGEVFAPVVMDCRGCTVRIGDALLDEVPVIVEEGRCCFRRHLADTARLRIVEVRDEQNAI